jgi:hypothetical protein
MGGGGGTKYTHVSKYKNDTIKREKKILHMSKNMKHLAF